MSTQPSTELEAFENPNSQRSYVIRFECPEFTCLCPRTGQPDFATIRVRYVPDKLCVELKSLKLYLGSYRSEGAFHEAVTNRYLVVFEKDFKRNYIHIRDVADCFVHCIDHADDMVGRPYNVGLDEANLSKEQLALKIKEYVPDFYIHFSEIGSDPDKRDYMVSNQRLSDAGFAARRSLDDGIPELIKSYRMMGRAPYANI